MAVVQIALAVGILVVGIPLGVILVHDGNPKLAALLVCMVIVMALVLGLSVMSSSSFAMFRK